MRACTRDGVPKVANVDAHLPQLLFASRLTFRAWEGGRGAVVERVTASRDLDGEDVHVERVLHFELGRADVKLANLHDALRGDWHNLMSGGRLWISPF